MAELIKVIYKDEKGLPVTIECSAIEVYGSNMAFSDEDQDLIRDDNRKIIEVPVTQLNSVQPLKRKK